MVTFNPLACNNLASEAAIIPFPNEDVTPPVTKMYFAIIMVKSFIYKIEYILNWDPSIENNSASESWNKPADVANNILRLAQYCVRIVGRSCKDTTLRHCV
jgi:hypothetical protein